MDIRGGVNFSVENSVRGWCFNSQKEDPIQAHLFYNGEMIMSSLASQRRSFLVRDKVHPTGKCGYSFDVAKQLDTSSEVEMKVFFDEKKVTLHQNFKYYNSDVPKKKIFFLHIPKAAGSSLNKMLAKQYDDENVRFHIEGLRGDGFKKLNVSQLDMFSGHVRLFEVIKHFGLQGFLRVTVVRDPLQHLISHLNWVKHISENKLSPFFLSHPKPIRDVSLQLREFELSDFDKVKRFVENLNNMGLHLFNNCQTRYLLNDVAPLRLSKLHAAKAINTLHFFDVLGTVENMPLFVKKLSTRMGWGNEVKEEKTNALNNKYGLDKDSEELRGILTPLINIDQLVYDHIKQITEVDQ